jgi:hypothetical protein
MNTPANQELDAFLNKARPLPAPPESIPNPEVDYSFNVVGAIVTEITVAGKVGVVTFRSGPMAEPTIDAWGLTAPFFAEMSTKDQEAFLAWGRAAHIRLLATVADFLKGMSETVPGFKADTIACAIS